MNRLLPITAVAALLLSACGSGSTDGTAATAAGTGALSQSECAEIAQKYHDIARSVLPNADDAMANSLLEAAKNAQTEACVDGTSWTRKDYDCIKAASGPEAFNRCMEDADNEA